MTQDLTEEVMRRALFGTPAPQAPIIVTPMKEPEPEVAFINAKTPVLKKKAAKAFTPRLRATLRVGNEFEGEMREIFHETDTLSSLLAEQEAVKAARKKFRYVEVVSVKSM